jgi:hypothetical protein
MKTSPKLIPCINDNGLSAIEVEMNSVSKQRDENLDEKFDVINATPKNVSDRLQQKSHPMKIYLIRKGDREGEYLDDVWRRDIINEANIVATVAAITRARSAGSWLMPDGNVQMLGGVNQIGAIKSTSDDINQLRDLPTNELDKLFDNIPAKDKLDAFTGVLKPRDVLKIDPHFLISAEPCLVVRRHSIMINCVVVKAVIFFDKCFLVVPDGADQDVADFQHAMKHLEEQNSESKRSHLLLRNSIPFEFMALEAIFITMESQFDNDCSQLENLADKLLKRPGKLKARKEKPSKTLDAARNLASELDKELAKLASVQETLEAVLSNDEDMNNMNLTQLQLKPELWEINSNIKHDVPSFQHEEVECILEGYLESVQSLVERIKTMRRDVGHLMQEVVLNLDIARNRIMMVSLGLNIVTVALTFGALIAGIFGMNLHSGLEVAANSFKSVVICVITFILLFGSTLGWFLWKQGVWASI